MNLNKIIAGDTLDFSTNVTGYPPSAGWTLKYRLVPRVTGAAILIICAADTATDFHRAQVAPAVTAAYVAMDYSWSSWVEKTGARYTVDTGGITVAPDPSAVSIVDNRSTAQRNLDTLEAAISARISGDLITKYTIGSRSLEKESITHLLELRAQLRAQVATETAQTNLNSGKINARFTSIGFTLQ